MVEIASACLNDVEVIIEFKPGEDSFAWRTGELRTVMGSGENNLINVCMVEVEGVRENTLECQSTLQEIRYLDGGDDNDVNR